MISIIIPTLNEEGFLENTVEHARKMADASDRVEFIVVDAGSEDQTVAIARNLGLSVYEKPTFRFKKNESLNFGIAKANGKIVLFLDADTLLPPSFDLLIEETMTDPSCVGGAFEFSFHGSDWKLLMLTWINRIRYRLGKVFYGDQGVFARRAILEKMGGMPNEPLMETAFLCRQLRRHGKLSIIRQGVKTSPRRFQQHGFFKVAWFDLNMFIRFNLGIPVSSYAESYWRKNLPE